MPSNSAILKKYILEFATFEFFEHYVIFKINEGISYQSNNYLEFLSLCADFFQDKPFSIIDHRSSSFSLDPTMYITHGDLLPNIKAQAVVATANVQNIFNGAEKHCIKNWPTNTFDTLDAAINWIGQYQHC